jgi:RimJ/RimL family protein N-acetyltransferase
VSAGRVRLVPLEPRHLDLTRQWANDPDIMRLMGRAGEVSGAEHEAWFSTVVTSESCMYFAIETAAAGQHIGNAWLWSIDRRHQKAELRIVIGDAAVRGRGLGAEAIELACRHGFDRLGLHRIYAYVLALNPGARRAFERAGFTLEGTLRDDRRAGNGFVDAYALARIQGR